MTPAPTSEPARKNGHRRWLWLAGLCVVLGLVTSVGVAWRFAWQADHLHFSSHPSEGLHVVRQGDGTAAPMSWEVVRADWRIEGGPLVRNLFLPISTEAAEDELARQRALRSADPEAKFLRLAGDAASQRALARHLPLLLSEDGKYVMYSVTLAGWPLRCLAMEDACTREDATRIKKGNHFDLGGDSRTFVPVWNTAFNLRPHYNALQVGNHLLPTFPLWPGLLADTGIFAGAWGVLIFTPLGVRRWLRARRGGCPQCGYSREGLKDDAPCPECGHGA